MASSLDFTNYICEQLEGVGAIRSRKMFGEYMVYVNNKPVVLICDDTVFIKILPCLEGLLGEHPTGHPYGGAKEHYILDPDDGDTLRRAAALAEEVIPLPKRKKGESPGIAERVPVLRKGRGPGPGPAERRGEPCSR